MADINYDSFTKSWEIFNKIHGAAWMKHIHPQDRDEMCGYLIRMVGDDGTVKFNAWNATTNRPNSIEKLEGCVKTLIRCVSDRNYFVECPTRES